MSMRNVLASKRGFRPTFSGLMALGLSLLLLLSSCTTSDAPDVADPTAPSSPTETIDPSSRPTSDTETTTDTETEPDSNSSSTETRGQVLPITAQAEIAGELFELEVARTPEQQALGLMFRDELADNRGMLFPFANPRPTRFWMQNVSISLDMIFLRDGQVMAIADNVPPCTTPSCPTYGPDTLIDQVIELRGGRAEELGLQPGDRIVVEFLDE